MKDFQFSSYQILDFSQLSSSRVASNFDFFQHNYSSLLTFDKEIYLIQFSFEDFKNDLLESMDRGYTWGSSVGVLLTASLLAISLISYLYNRN